MTGRYSLEVQATRTYIEMQDIKRDDQHLIVYSGRKARKERYGVSRRVMYQREP